MGDSLELIAQARPRTLDVAVIAAHLLNDVPLCPAQTIYSGIESELRADVWGPAGGALPCPPRAPGAALLAALEASIDRALGNAKRVAVLAGGGIDSSGLLALAIEAMRRRGGTAFAVALDFASDGDDRPHLRALEQHLGCEVVRVSPREGARELGLLREGVDGAPLCWPFSLAQVSLYRAARSHGADKLLTGAGGDDLFDGDPRALAELVRRHPLRAVHTSRMLQGFESPRFPALEWIVRPYAARLIPRSWRRSRARRRRWASPADRWAGPRMEEISRLLFDRKLDIALAPPSRTDVDGYFAHPGLHHFRWIVHLEQMAGGLDREDPFFTREVAETVASMPAMALLANRRRRGLFREAMRGRVPDSVLDRSDKAAFAPAFQMFFEAAGGLRAFAEELQGANLIRLGLVDARSFSREIANALSSPDEDGRYGYAWAAVATEAFLLAHPELT